MNEIFYHAKKGEKSCIAILDPAKDKVDWFIKDVVDE